jgi:magnesium transporter
MDVQPIGDTGVVRHRAEDLPALLERGQGLVWVDIPTGDEEAVRVRSEVFGFHPLAIRDCVERNHVAKVHAYPDHVFVVLHAPERGQGGHVGRLHPSSSYELPHAIVSALTRHQEAFVATLAREVGLLEQQVMDAGVGDPEQFLEEMFRARHGLVANRTMAHPQQRDLWPDGDPHPVPA